MTEALQPRHALLQIQYLRSPAARLRLYLLLSIFSNNVPCLVFVNVGAVELKYY